MTAFIVYSIAFVLTVVCLEFFKYKNRIWPVLLILSFFFPILNLCVVCTMIIASAVNSTSVYSDGVCIRDTKLNRWLFNGLDEDCFIL